jgi:alkyl sulfatase BDS1-like metallo-beta-lactamase superfamily hydrolase
LDGHFHPKGKAPSKFTLEVLKQATAKLPFVDKRDFEEQKKGFIAPMTISKADLGYIRAPSNLRRTALRRASMR